MFYRRSVFFFPGRQDVKATPCCCVTFFLFHTVVTLETFNKLFSTPFHAVSFIWKNLLVKGFLSDEQKRDSFCVSLKIHEHEQNTFKGQ